ncbi:phage tail protein [Mesoterricola silvestris]|uniref:Phage tail protein n=1 Tax=Mesoterricola silvestris TaxID=2927979 RepID=A0AA48GGK0_9BACT|nr:phage tail protein [Mesoterricola silvestris]BDU72401.1 hypothetical protein METEAL_15750 [Mesoterricola silvestris]
MAAFTYIPDWGPDPSLEPATRTVNLGDGYEQRSNKGLNPYLPTWNLTFSKRSQGEAQAIAAWFIANTANVTAFTWTAPDGDTGLWVADKWTPAKPVDYNSWAVSAIFRKVPA